jgi:hypothetical protein
MLLLLHIKKMVDQMLSSRFLSFPLQEQGAYHYRLAVNFRRRLLLLPVSRRWQ